VLETYNADQATDVFVELMAAWNVLGHANSWVLMFLMMANIIILTALHVVSVMLVKFNVLTCVLFSKSHVIPASRM